VIGRQLGNISVDSNQLHADADAGDETPGIHRDRRGLERGGERRHRIDEHGRREHGAAAEAVGEAAQRDGADEHAREERAEETREAVHVEHARRGGAVEAAVDQAERDIGGHEHLVELEPAADGDARDQAAKVAGRRQAVEPRGHARLDSARRATLLLQIHECLQ
jgi:hypothetical protein